MAGSLGRGRAAQAATTTARSASGMGRFRGRLPARYLTRPGAVVAPVLAKGFEIEARVRTPARVRSSAVGPYGFDRCDGATASPRPVWSGAGRGRAMTGRGEGGERGPRRPANAGRRWGRPGRGPVHGARPSPGA